MSTVTLRDLRDNSASMLTRVARGESLTITKDGSPVAAVIPLPRTPINAEQLVERFKKLPPIGGGQLREGLDTVLIQSL